MAAEAKWTDGPWEATGDSIWAISPWNARVRLATVTWFAPMNGINWQANARLIAAAPDLFEALEELLFEDSDKSEQARLVTRIKARAALAKASPQ